MTAGAPEVRWSSYRAPDSVPAALARTRHLPVAGFQLPAESTDHELGELLDRGLRHLGVDGHLSLLDHVEPVAQREEVGVVVVDDDHGHPPSREVLHQVHDQRRLLGPHGRQGLVEEEDLGVEPCGAGHRDRLALAAGEHLDLLVQVRDIDLDVVEVLPGQGAHAPARQHADPAEGGDLTVEEQVFVHGQLRHQGEVLVHRLDAVGPGVLYGVEGDLLALHEDAARVRPLEPAQDLDQGALAGPVVAHQARAPRPGGGARSTPSRATTAPKRLEIPSTRRMTSSEIVRCPSVVVAAGRTFCRAVPGPSGAVLIFGASLLTGSVGR